MSFLVGFRLILISILDEMGLGKTVELLACIMSNSYKSLNSEPDQDAEKEANHDIEAPAQDAEKEANHDIEAPEQEAENQEKEAPLLGDGNQSAQREQVLGLCLWYSLVSLAYSVYCED